MNESKILAVSAKYNTHNGKFLVSIVTWIFYFNKI